MIVIAGACKVPAMLGVICHVAEWWYWWEPAPPSSSAENPIAGCILIDSRKCDVMCEQHSTTPPGKKKELSFLRALLLCHILYPQCHQLGQNRNKSFQSCMTSVKIVSSSWVYAFRGAWTSVIASIFLFFGLWCRSFRKHHVSIFHMICVPSLHIHLVLIPGCQHTRKRVFLINTVHC